MFCKQRFGDDGTRAARAQQAGNRDEKVYEKNNEIAHHQVIVLNLSSITNLGNRRHFIQNWNSHPTRSLPHGRALNAKELDRLQKHCRRDTSVKGVRDMALLATLVSTGLRRAEIAGLALHQYERKAGRRFDPARLQQISL
jgi:integrase